MTKIRNHVAIGASVLALCQTGGALARVGRIEVEKIMPAPAVPGAEPYEIVSGRFRGELDPGALSKGWPAWRLAASRAG